MLRVEGVGYRVKGLGFRVKGLVTEKEWGSGSYHLV